MNKMKATRDFRHGRTVVKVGDSFEASPVDSEYYTKFNFAVASEVAPEEESTGNYQRRDMRASGTRVTAETKTPPRPRGRPSTAKFSGPEKPAAPVAISGPSVEEVSGTDEAPHSNS